MIFVWCRTLDMQVGSPVIGYLAEELSPDLAFSKD